MVDPPLEERWWDRLIVPGLCVGPLALVWVVIELVGDVRAGAFWALAGGLGLAAAAVILGLIDHALSDPWDALDEFFGALPFALAAVGALLTAAAGFAVLFVAALFD